MLPSTAIGADRASVESRTAVGRSRRDAERRAEERATVDASRPERWSSRRAASTCRRRRSTCRCRSPPRSRPRRSARRCRRRACRSPRRRSACRSRSSEASGDERPVRAVAGEGVVRSARRRRRRPQPDARHFDCEQFGSIASAVIAARRRVVRAAERQDAGHVALLGPASVQLPALFLPRPLALPLSCAHDFCAFAVSWNGTASGGIRPLPQPPPPPAVPQAPRSRPGLVLQRIRFGLRVNGAFGVECDDAAIPAMSAAAKAVAATRPRRPTCVSSFLLLSLGSHRGRTRSTGPA